MSWACKPLLGSQLAQERHELFQSLFFLASEDRRRRWARTGIDWLAIWFDARLGHIGGILTAYIVSSAAVGHSICVACIRYATVIKVVGIPC